MLVYNGACGRIHGMKQWKQISWCTTEEVIKNWNSWELVFKKTHSSQHKGGPKNILSMLVCAQPWPQYPFCPINHLPYLISLLSLNIHPSSAHILYSFILCVTSYLTLQSLYTSLPLLLTVFSPITSFLYLHISLPLLCHTSSLNLISAIIFNAPSNPPSCTIFCGPFYVPLHPHLLLRHLAHCLLLLDLLSPSHFYISYQAILSTMFITLHLPSFHL